MSQGCRKVRQLEPPNSDVGAWVLQGKYTVSCMHLHSSPVAFIVLVLCDCDHQGGPSLVSVERSLPLSLTADSSRLFNSTSVSVINTQEKKTP